MILLDTITPDLQKILGIANFQCAPIASLLRIDGQEIPHKSEAEQAAVLWWLLGIYAKHGDGWQPIAGAELERIKAVAIEQDERQP
jgi:hypothetical protein